MNTSCVTFSSIIGIISIIFLFSACSDETKEILDNNNINTTPIYKVVTEDITLEEYVTYTDKWKTIYTKKKVINTNPNAVVADSTLNRLTKEENEKMSIYKEFNNTFYTTDIAFELNGNRLQCTAYYNTLALTDSFIPTTRTEIINQYCRENFSSLVTTIPNAPNAVSLRPRVHEPHHIAIWQEEKRWFSDFISASYFNTIDKIDMSEVDYLPEVYRLVADRFNKREYEGFDLEKQQVTTDRFKTIVRPGKLSDLEGYQRPKIIPEGWEPFFNSNKNYGLIYIYKNDELLTCGIITGYTEEWTENDNSIDYICCFNAVTGLNGNYVQINYEFPGNSCFSIQELHFSTSTGYPDIIKEERYYTNDDFKENHPMTFGHKDLKTRLIE